MSEILRIEDENGNVYEFTNNSTYKIGLVAIVRRRILGFVDDGLINPCTWDLKGRLQMGKHNLNDDVKFDLSPFDKLEDLKRASKEGAIIESKFPDESTWEEMVDPEFNSELLEYRIKGGIKVEHWNEHKEQIKAYWDGATLQMRGKDSGSWFSVRCPDWTAYVYRVKEEIKELTIEELEKELGYKIKVVGEK